MPVWTIRKVAVVARGAARGRRSPSRSKPIGMLTIGRSASSGIAARIRAAASSAQLITADTRAQRAAHPAQFGARCSAVGCDAHLVERPRVLEVGDPRHAEAARHLGSGVGRVVRVPRRQHEIDARADTGAELASRP